MKKLFLILLITFASNINAQPLKEDTTDIFIGKVNSYSLVYDCHDCKQGVSGGITVSYKKKKTKIHILDQVISDFYVDEVSVMKIKGKDFIYIGSTHTYGHSQGYLYYLNTEKMKAYQVISKKDNYKIPDTMHIRKYFDLSKDATNNLGYGATLWTQSGKQGFLDGSYTVKMVKPNYYILVSSKPNWSIDEE